MLAVGAEETAAFRQQTADFSAAWRAINSGDREMVVAGAHHYSIVLDFAAPDGALFGAALRFLLSV